MNLTKLFETQKKLDERIIEEKGLHGQDLLDKKILALQVELGELAQNWRGFKFWSEDNKPRTRASRSARDFLGQPIIKYYNPLLEEYVDCLHFILSIGLSKTEQYGVMAPVCLGFRKASSVKNENITKQFNVLFSQVSYLEDCIFDNAFGSDTEVGEQYEFLVRLFLGLGEMLDFTPEQVESAYYEKNAENHRRQEVGY